ncbi:Uncharacterised protein [Mycobacteroides abscessus subsp. abscessus]|uniref:hypothetical protein n=1 Tax=Mycobacteroides abscessus TaxID=36809 RepID=UPI000927088C|nr:hypothetical protein [Mycobacteroides abscessus]SIC07505.1 Uncharacterised protein [Mycobacteroides abscessus subsp. abscessus]
MTEAKRTPAAAFIRQVTSSTIYRPDGVTARTQSPAVWTLAHRGYSGGGRLDVWAYPTKEAALKAGAVLAMECGLDSDAAAKVLMASGKFEAVMKRYEETSPDTHLLRVQPAFLNWPNES